MASESASDGQDSASRKGAALISSCANDEQDFMAALISITEEKFNELQDGDVHALRTDVSEEYIDCRARVLDVARKFVELCGNGVFEQQSITPLVPEARQYKSLQDDNKSGAYSTAAYLQWILVLAFLEIIVVCLLAVSLCGEGYLGPCESALGLLTRGSSRIF